MYNKMREALITASYVGFVCNIGIFIWAYKTGDYEMKMLSIMNMMLLSFAMFNRIPEEESE